MCLSNPNLILSVLREQAIDLVLLDMNFAAGQQTGNEGIFWLREILRADPQAVVILITAYGDVELTVKAIREGGTDFIVKPWDPRKLIVTLQSALKLRRSRLEVSRLRGMQELDREKLEKKYTILPTASPAMQEVMKVVEKAAPTDANILITGESGTGKEHLAWQIHSLSLRKHGPFVPVDLGALSGSLFEDELFGHLQGAFTDAREDRMGRFEAAGGGTLFLDEIGNLPPGLQPKLLSAIQDRQISRLGATLPLPVDVRLVCATNLDLEEMVRERRFREDLLFRINTIHIHLPPLRERPEDIPLLADHFFRLYEQKYGKPAFRPTRRAYERLARLPWPGNIRELQHLVEKTVILSEGQVLTEESFPDPGARPVRLRPGASLAERERHAILEALDSSGGNISEAARLLGISRTTLYSKLDKHGLQEYLP